MNQAILDSKKSVVSEIQDKFAKASSTVVAEYRGLSVSEVTELRRTLRAENVEMKVYKNTLAAKAAEAAGFSELADVLTGPNTLVFSDDAVAPSRIMAKFAKKHKALVLKGGIVEGKVVPVETINELSLLSNREGMLSMLLSVLQAPVSQFARTVKAVADKKETEGPQNETPAAEEKPAEEVKAEAAEEAAA